MLKEFQLDSVQVRDPYYVNAFKKVVRYLLSLDPTRLLAGFRVVAEGKDPQNETNINLYGGWEGGWSLLRGHTMGHYLTAMAQAYKQTKHTDPGVNTQIGEKLAYTVRELKAYQDATPNGFLFASPETHFDVVEGKCSGNQWVPWYTMHKIITGLVHVYNYTDNQTALEIAARLGDWTYARASGWDANLRTRVLNVEYGGMNDALYELYKVTGERRHLQAAQLFDEDSLFSHIIAGKNVLENRHANTQIPKFVGALNRYRVLGEGAEFYHQVAEKFWSMVVNDHTYVTGGNSECEHFRQPGQLDATRTELNNETCNAYNMLLLTRELFKLSGDVNYAHFYERALLNEILASLNPETGMTTYFKPMATGYFKAFGTETESFWCCTGTGMENFTKLNDSIYFHTDHELYVNLYISSQVNWSAQGFSLIQAANIPQDEKVFFTIETAPADPVTLKFRIPDWIAPGHEVDVTVNGEVIPINIADGYLVLEQVWSSGDRITLQLPMAVHVASLPDNKDVVAFCYGPVVLSAQLGTEEMVVIGHWASAKATIPDGVRIKDYLIIQTGSIADWLARITENLVKTPGKLEFTLRGTDEEQLKFTPYYLEYEQRYGIYYQIVTLDSPAYKGIVQARQGAIRLAQATIDAVKLTNDQHELLHNLQGNSVSGFHGGYNFRQAHGTSDGVGWLSYDLAIDLAVENYLTVKYSSEDAGRAFNIYIDDQLLVAETISAQEATDFYDVQYLIPAELLVGKSTVTVKFANRGSGHAGRLFDRIAVLNVKL